jgi:hypothetical protein
MIVSGLLRVAQAWLCYAIGFKFWTLFPCCGVWSWMKNKQPIGFYVVWTLVLLLVIAHQDYWLWNDATLVWGFLPIGLFFHACLSVAAAIVWFLAIKFAWPANLEPTVQAETPTDREGAAS